MAASIRRFGTEMLIRVTSGICDRGRLNAQLAGALVEARSHDWRVALSLYSDEYVGRPRRTSAA